MQVPGKGVLAEAGTPEGIHLPLVDVCGLNNKANHKELRWGSGGGGSGRATERSRERRDQENKRVWGRKKKGKRGETERTCYTLNRVPLEWVC